MAHKRFTLKNGKNGFEFANLMRDKFEGDIIPDYSRRTGSFKGGDRYDFEGVSVDVMASNPLVMLMIGADKEVIGKTKVKIKHITGYELITDREQTRYWSNLKW